MEKSVKKDTIILVRSDDGFGAIPLGVNFPAHILVTAAAVDGNCTLSDHVASECFELVVDAQLPFRFGGAPIFILLIVPVFIRLDVFRGVLVLDFVLVISRIFL
ncbi:hypothetical protein MD484_g4694, partial [Candolleomyces efflorescens]